ncbi:MAG: hypothetical protein RR904_06245 [Bacilli bacterium]
MNIIESIKKDFDQILFNHYEVEIDRNVYVVDGFPKTIKNEKYFDYRDYILMKNKYKVLHKPLLALCKIFMYDTNVYIVSKEENFDWSEYVKLDNLYSLKRFEDYVLKGLKRDRPIGILYKDLNIGVLINDGYITYTDLGNGDIELVDQIFKSEGLFIRKG